MRFTVVGYHLRDCAVQREVLLRFVRHAQGLAVKLGEVPIALIEKLPQEHCYRIRTGPWAPQLSTEFVSLHAEVYATEHLLQTGGSAEWRTWPAEVQSIEHQRLRIHMG